MSGLLVWGWALFLHECNTLLFFKTVSIVAYVFFGASAFSVCSAVKFKVIYSNFTGKLDSAPHGTVGIVSVSFLRRL